MTIFATMNPVGSTSPKDLKDNSQNLDLMLLGPLPSYPDRRGVNRLSWAGIEASFAAAQAQRNAQHNADQARRESEFDADQDNREVQFNTFMDASGYEPPIPYGPGILLDRTTKTVSYLGNEYRAKGSFLPFTTSNWATDEAKLKLVGDDSLRQQLANPTDPSKGAGMVGRGWQAADAIWQARLLLKTSPSKYAEVFGYYTKGDGGGGLYYLDEADTTSADNGGTIIVADDGGRWKLNYRRELTAKQFGAVVGANNSTITQTLLNVCAAAKVTAVLDVDSDIQGVAVPSGIEIHQRCNLSNPLNGTTDLFTIDSVAAVKYIGHRHSGRRITRTGTAKAFQIKSATPYGVSNIELDGIEITGGSGQGVNWYNADKLHIHDCHVHDMGGTGIYGADILNQKSRKVRINGNLIEDLAHATNICHGISINQWPGCDDVEVHSNHVYRTRNNPVEVWGSVVSIKDNVTADGAILISCGACTKLTVTGNQGWATDPTADRVQIGIEVGGCHTFNISDNTMTGVNNGIDFTGANIGAAGGTWWPIRFSPVSLYSKAGRLNYANPALLQVLSPRDTASGNNFSGSYVGMLTNNTIVGVRNLGISAGMDGYFSESVLVRGNKVSGQGRAIAPKAGAHGPISLTGGRFELDGNSFTDCLGGINVTNAATYWGPNSFKDIDASPIINMLGVAANAHFSCRQNIRNCAISQAVAGTIPVQGTWEAGDTLYNHTPAAGGSHSIICTTPGTQSTQLNAITVTTTAGSAVVVASSLGDMQIGYTFTIAGVAGRKRVKDIDISNNAVTLDAVCDASVTSAAITNSAATFKSLGSVAA